MAELPVVPDGLRAGQVGDALAVRVRAFRWSLRRAASELPQDVLAGPLLPYALRFGLISDDESPLARFAHAAVRTLANEPGWMPPQPERMTRDEVPMSNPDSPPGYWAGY